MCGFVFCQATSMSKLGVPFESTSIKAYIMKTILLVDDSATILLSMSAILTKAGYATEKSASAEEGMSKLKGGLKPDLLITDLNDARYEWHRIYPGSAQDSESAFYADFVSNYRVAAV